MPDTDPPTTIYSDSRAACKERCLELLDMLIDHCGYGDMQVDVKIHKKGRKEVIIRCGRHWRFIVPANIASHGGGNGCCQDGGAEDEGTATLLA
ncbi:MAG: hypothetical protein ACOCXA_05640 [Planctomycetota bacterium]